MNTTNNQSNVVLKAIKQVEYDRVVFLTYTNSVLSGLNFHQGIDNLDYDFANPNEALTNIYDRLGKPSDAFEMSRVNKAISLYCIVMKNGNRFIDYRKVAQLLKELKTV